MKLMSDPIRQLAAIVFFVGMPVWGIILFYLIWKTLTFIGILYLLWIYLLDARTPEQGGRSSDWVRSLKLWKYAYGYFPTKMQCVPDCKLDETKNYLFCCHPHGILPYGTILTSIYRNKSYLKPLKNHKFYLTTVKFNFMIPIYREALLAMGFCSPTSTSLNFILNDPVGGNIAVLFPGGAEEAYKSKNGEYHLVLKNRKGFIKLALKNGYPIVPVISFGEVDNFDQLRFQKGSIFANIQELMRYVIGIAPTFCFGSLYLPIPVRAPINVIVGKPLYTEKVLNPTLEDINALHQKYITQLVELFEKQKYNYLTKGDSTTLHIE